MSVASPATSGSPTPPPRPSGGDAGLKQRVHRRLVAAGGLDALDHLDEHDRPGRALAVRTRLAELLHDEAPLLTPARFEHLLGELTDEVSGLGPLEPLLADPEVSEVMLNGPGRAYVERAGRLEAVELDLDAGGIVRLVERVVAPLGLRLDLCVAVAFVAKGTLDAVLIALDQSRLVGCTHDCAQRIHEEFVFSRHGFLRFHALEFHARHPN